MQPISSLALILWPYLPILGVKSLAIESHNCRSSFYDGTVLRSISQSVIFWWNGTWYVNNLEVWKLLVWCRVDCKNYNISNSSKHSSGNLLVVQIDAAINPGVHPGCLFCIYAAAFFATHLQLLFSLHLCSCCFRYTFVTAVFATTMLLPNSSTCILLLLLVPAMGPYLLSHISMPSRCLMMWFGCAQATAVVRASIIKAMWPELHSRWFQHVAGCDWLLLCYVSHCDVSYSVLYATHVTCGALTYCVVCFAVLCASLHSHSQSYGRLWHAAAVQGLSADNVDNIGWGFQDRIHSMTWELPFHT